MAHPVLVLFGFYVVCKCLKDMSHALNSCSQALSPGSVETRPTSCRTESRSGKIILFFFMGFLALLIYVELPVAWQIILPMGGFGGWLCYRLSRRKRAEAAKIVAREAVHRLAEDATIPSHLAGLGEMIRKLQMQIARAESEPPGSLPARSLNVSSVFLKYRAAVSELAGALNNLGAAVEDSATTPADLERAFDCFESPLTIIVNAKRTLWEVEENPLLRTGRDHLLSLLTKPLRQMDDFCITLRDVLDDPQGAVMRNGSLTLSVKVSFRCDEELAELRDWVSRAGKNYPIEANALWGN